MFCAKCGTENTEGAAFCKNCGIQMDSVLPAEQTPAAPAAPVYAAPAPAMVKPPLSSHPVLNAVKKLASSPLFLVAAIAFSAQILFSLLGTLIGGTVFEAIFYEIIDELAYELPYSVTDALYSIGTAPLVIGAIIGLIPSMIVCAGLWITYSSARSRMSDTMKTSGLTMIKVINVIQLVCSCIVLALVELVLMLAVIIVAEEAYSPGAAIAILVIAVIFFTAVFVLEIVYLAKVIKSVNAAKNTITTGVPAAKASSFVAVWAFIGAAGLIFSLITNFFASAASITSLICFGILIFKYNSSMRALMAPAPAPAQYVAPVE